MKEKCCDMCITEHMDKEKRDKLLLRLRKIKGQIEGIMKMIEDDRKCIEILNQINSFIQASRGVQKEILRNYLKRCVTSAILEGKEDIYDEVVEVFDKYHA